MLELHPCRSTGRDDYFLASPVIYDPVVTRNYGSASRYGRYFCRLFIRIWIFTVSRRFRDSREITLEVLSQEPEGAFMVRESTSKPGCYALSLRVPREFQPSGIAHYLIMRTNKGYKIKVNLLLLFAGSSLNGRSRESLLNVSERV